MRRIVSKIIRAHPLLHQLALRAYMPLERHVGRIRRANQLTPDMETMRRVIAPRNRRPARSAGPKVLFLSTRGFNFHMLVDGVLAHGLRLRGADVHFYTCGGGLSLCDLSFENVGITPQHCEFCTDCALKSISSFGFDKPHTLRGLLSDSEIQAWTDRAESIEDPATYTYKGYAVGEAASVSLRYVFRSSKMPDYERTLPYWRRMVVSACMLVDAYERLLTREKFDRLFIFSGLGYPERIMVWMAQRMGIPYATYEVGMQPGTLVISPEDMASWMPVGEGWDYWSKRPLDEEEDRELDRFLAEREGGGGGASLYWPTIQKDLDRIRERLDIPEGARVVSCFTNVTWDLGIIDRHG
ncbi:MAG: Capsule polysaccharide biosynthesis protein, partial [Armatimonadetes bacterium]|nr:Capsule polysaccharide biosynthesis protein [Armatimonadota bacterium]